MKLSEGEKREIIKLIESGRALPDKYRFLLFDDKREVELVWKGRRKVAEKVVDIFGKDTMRIIEIGAGGE